jgi:hypothetical protein
MLVIAHQHKNGYLPFLKIATDQKPWLNGMSVSWQILQQCG